MHLPEHNVWYEDEWWYINPQSYFMDNKGAPVIPWHLGDVQEHADAALYYGSFGLLDPKMPFEAFAIKRAKGWLGVRGLAMGGATSMAAGFVLAAIVGWAFDPADRRKGGIMQSQAWNRFVTGDWFGLNSSSS